MYFNNVDKAVIRAKQMVAEGADIIDIGGESTRPGSEPVTETEELRRVIPVIDQLTREITVPISIDTYKPRVVREAFGHGATMLNDITGLINPEMIAVAAEFEQPVVIMHMQGTPQTMQTNPSYQDVIGDIKRFFRERIAAARIAGIQEIILDPGIGFGKTLEHNLIILKRLDEFIELGYPLLVGPSRKSFIGTITSQLVNQRIPGTIAAVVIAALNGARIVRVHDVAACRHTLQIVDAIRSI